MQTNIFKLTILISFILQCIGQDKMFCGHYHFVMLSKPGTLIGLYYENNSVKECEDFGKLNSSEAVLLHIGGYLNSCLTITTSKRAFLSVKKLCPVINREDVWTSIIFRTMPKKSRIILPGTLWCGAGNNAQQDGDLGLFKKVDACCRAHDKCPDTISVGETNYNITNNKIATVSHCDCDDEFYNCLQKVGSAVSAAVGKTYFNILGMPCFKIDYPILKCLDMHVISWQCQGFLFDKRKPKQYQLFDAKYYKNI